MCYSFRSSVSTFFIAMITVYLMYRRQTKIEYNFKYQDAITNTGILATLVPDSARTLSVPKYDMNGFRYADE